MQTGGSPWKATVSVEGLCSQAVCGPAKRSMEGLCSQESRPFVLLIDAADGRA